ncbi:hypothetical protein [Phyllobacterium chamaecytisi]|uniref:hypothetical protein n=1 Tax=Phyllobacterium chamaecytisi TaxID=2876082 RepID=UPI001CCBBEE1|nr:hypothetical protein [Phyllobacterium sp. KW56]MBZ9600702.1 hypothetical protein [Phyllobacterium sp. KW56]
MSDALAHRTIVAVKFGFSPNLYDFFSDIPVEVGQKVYVATSRGETKATIVEIKTESDRAERFVLRFVSEDVRTDDQRATKHPNGFPVFSRDGTMLDEHGNRSIFDDVDQ